ncbi:MAG: hypothetical protein RL094_239 [Candidatus Parcubacteria bacterium]|jgi:glycosyltransferase involved in cell wall biosynthesis
MSQKNPFFSVIIPTYNSEQFIRRTVTSVLQQTYSDFELIIIDDGSKDETSTILLELSSEDSRIKVITTTNSGGPTVPTNVGIDVSKGSYIAFLDHDDEWRSNKLEILHTFFTLNPQIGFIASNVEHINDLTGLITTAKVKITKGSLSKKELLAGKYFNTFSMLCIKRSVLEKVGYLDTQLKMFADFDLVTRMIDQDIPYIFLPDVLVRYHIHNNNTSNILTSSKERLRDLTHIITKYENTFLKFPSSYSNVLHSIAGLHLYNKEQKQAIHYLKKSIKIHPFNALSYIKLGMAYLGNKPFNIVRSLKRKATRIIS